MQIIVSRHHSAHCVALKRQFVGRRGQLLLLRARIQPAGTRRPEVNLNVPQRLSLPRVEVLRVEEPAVAFFLSGALGPAFLHMRAQVTCFRQLVLLQVRGSLRPGDLRLKVPLFEMHFV